MEAKYKIGYIDEDIRQVKKIIEINVFLIIIKYEDLN
jgi:hypothetical protein